MRSFFALAGCFVLMAVSCTQHPETPPALLSLELKTMEGTLFSTSEISRNKASVFLFLQPECPFCHSYGKTFHHLDSLLQSRDIQLYGVMAGIHYPVDDLKSYSEKYRLNFPMLLDPDFQLTRSLKATITPQVFLLDNQGKTVYRGMVDNWGYEIGKTRARATAFYLLDAVAAFEQGRPQPLDSTKAIGCFIQ